MCGCAFVLPPCLSPSLRGSGLKYDAGQPHHDTAKVSLLQKNELTETSIVF